MATKHVYFDGTQKANITFDQYPDAAWTDLSPTQADMGSRRERLEAAQAYHSTVGWYFHCVDLRANGILKVPWAITRDDDDEDVWTSQDRHPPQQLEFLRKLETFLWLTEAALCVAPEAFWFRERNRVRTLELHWHSPLSVEPQWDEDEGLVGFKRRLSRGRSRVFAPEDYVYIPRPNALHETQPGTPPGQAAISAAGVLHNVDAFAAAFFERGAIKATVLTIEGNPQQTEIEKLERWWKRFFQGIKKAWQTAAVRMGIEPVVVGEGMESLHENELTQEKKEDIAAAFGIPASIAWSGNASGLGGGGVSEVDERHFYDKTVIPDFKLIARHINEQMLEPMGLYLEPRQNEMTIFQADENERSKALLNYVNAGMKLSTAAETLGIDLPAGMEYAELDEVDEEPEQEQMPEMVPAQVVESGRPQLPPPESEEKRAERGQLRRWYTNRNDPDLADFNAIYLSETEKRAIVADLVEDGDAEDNPFTVPDCWRGKSIPDAAESIAAWKAVLQLVPDDDEDSDAEREARMPTERRARRNIARSLNGQQRRILDSGVENLDAADVGRWARQDLEAALARQPTEDELYDVLRRALIESVDLGVSVSVQQLENVGFGFDWTLANERARRWANRHTGELIRGINDTTRRQVRQSVVQWIENGEPLDALIDEFAPIFGRQRAELIASTEVTQAFAQGQREGFRESGVVQVMEFRTAVDERVCPQCGPLHGTQQPLRGNFSRLLPDELIPRSTPDIPPIHPRCRCWLAPVVPD